MTNVKTGWTIHFARLNKAATGVLKALDKALAALPRGLTGIHSDTGANASTDRSIRGAMPRGSPTHKHDRCYIAQKKYAPSVRPSGISVTRAWRARLYQNSVLQVFKGIELL
jgi:hypothetical protein